LKQTEEERIRRNEIHLECAKKRKLNLSDEEKELKMKKRVNWMVSRI
jgi:hypothetical protein